MSEGHRSRGRGMGDPITRGENESGVSHEPIIGQMGCFLASDWLTLTRSERRCADALMRSTCSVRLRL